VATTNYTYVGMGAGDIQMVTVPTKYRSCYCVVLVSLLLVLLYLLLPFLSQDTTTTTPIIPDTTPTTTQPQPRKSCEIFGDPHAMTFDGMHADYYTSGEFWIVKSGPLEIQGKYRPTHATNGLAVTKKIGVGGSLMQGHTLIIGEETATYDGAAILTTFPSTYQSPDGLVKIVYDAHGELLQPGREGKDMHVLHVLLPGGTTLQVNRWNEAGEGRYINTKITMSAIPGQDGQCGNFNGIAADDARLAVKARLGQDGVPEGELLPGLGPKTPIDQGIEACPDSTLIRATRSARRSPGLSGLRCLA